MTRVMVEDPRWIEFREANARVSQGLSAPAGAHERYRQALGPYVQLLAEHTPLHVRRHMIEALYDDGFSVGLLAFGFQATEDELGLIMNRPPIEELVEDEIDRLRRMPYAQYLRTPHWKTVRRDALRRAEHRCMLCNTTQNLQVHHRTYQRRGSERPADVAVLCDVCHSRHHGHLRAA